MLTPYYQDASTVIYHGDCRGVLDDLSPGSVDLLLTDPPYGIGYVTSMRSRNDPLRTGIAGDADVSLVAEVAPLLAQVLAAPSAWYIFASPRRIGEMVAALAPHLLTRQVLAWDKGDRGTVGDLECGFGEAWEAILYGLHGGRVPLQGPRPRSVVRHDWSGALDPVHPTTKPVSLLGRFIGWSCPGGGLVLDPFCGSGTTLRAAKDLGRRAIGIEIEERYCEVAAHRLSQEVLSL